MTLAHRFFYFLAPVVLLIGAWSGVAYWVDYRQEVAFIAGKAMETDIRELQLLAGHPVFGNYRRHLDEGAEEAAARDLREIHSLFRFRLEVARQYDRLPDHMILFSPEWEILALESDDASLNAKAQLEHSDIHAEPFYRHYRDFSVPYSWLDGDHHKTVVAIGQDRDGDGVLAKDEVRWFLHSEFLLPLADFREEAWRRMLGNLVTALGQVGVLIVALFWAGRGIPRPFQEFTGRIAAIAHGDFATPFPRSWKIRELDLLSQALNRMETELATRESHLIQARNQAEESRVMLRQVLDAIPVNLFWKDADFRYMGCNARFARHAGLAAPEELLNRCDGELAWRHDADSLREIDREVMVSGVGRLNEARRILLTDGTERWLEISTVPLTDVDGAIIGVLGVSQDITERRRLEEELRFSRFSVMNAQDAIYWIDSRGRFITVNQAAWMGLGHTREELLALTIHDIAPQLSAAEWPGFWERMTRQRTLVFTTAQHRKDGSSFPVEVSVNMLEYQGTSFAMASARDITERQKAEQALKEYADRLEEMVQARTRQLIHAERLATLGTFSAGMAHEINNPNAFISANIQFLQQYWGLAGPVLLRHAGEDPSGRLSRFHAEIGKTLEGILDGSGRISKIVDSLKTYSKGGMETDRVECRLEDPVRDAIHLLQHRIRQDEAALTVRIPNDLIIYCDRQQMSQVFVNLFNNALDALEEMPTDHPKRITVVGQAIERHVWIWVKDNGPGIPAEAIDRIFDPFYTSKGKTKGTGLGLSIVEGIVKDHLGQITIFSPPRTAEYTETEVVIILPTLALHREQLAARKRSRPAQERGPGP
ncbi:MAG: PAS domain S-box protein [Magnetococcales bacterium]|nr:PAS domain S-box protein [Magnetococcales bacterium]